MQIVVIIPDEVAAAVVPEGQDAARAALEGLGLRAYQERRISEHELQRMLGMESRFEGMDFLKLHLPSFSSQTVEEIEGDLALLERLREREKADHAA